MLLFITGCNTNKEKTNELINNYSLQINSDYSSLIPDSILYDNISNNIILSGVEDGVSSTFYAGKIGDEKSLIFNKYVDEKNIKNILYSSPQDDKVFFIGFDENKTYNIFEYSILENDYKEIFSTNEKILIKLDYDKDGNIVAPLYEIDDKDEFYISSILIYDITSESVQHYEIPDDSKFKNSDYMPIEMRCCENGYITCFYDKNKKLYIITSYDYNFKEEYVIENERYTDEIFMGFCFSSKEDLLVHTYDSEDTMNVEVFDTKSGTPKEEYCILENYSEIIIDGNNQWDYYYNDSESVYGVKNNGEVFKLGNYSGNICNVFETDNECLVVGYINYFQNDTAYFLSQNGDICDKTDVPAEMDLIYYNSFSLGNEKKYALYIDENFNFKISCLSDEEKYFIDIFDHPDWYMQELLLYGDCIGAVVIDDNEEYEAILYSSDDLSKETSYNLGSWDGEVKFRLKNNKIYILNRKSDDDIYSIYEYNLDTEKTKEILTLECETAEFALNEGDFEFCIYSDDTLYCFSENKIEYTFEWKKYGYVPVVMNVSVVDKSNITIFGLDIYNKFMIYNFTESNGQFKEKKLINIVENLDLNDVYPGTGGSHVKKAIEIFNSTNTEYEIHHEYLSDSDIKLKLLSDDVPDIFIYSQNIDKSLADMFVDLSGYLPELNSGDYFNNIIDLGCEADKIYEVIPEFKIKSLYGEAQNISPEKIWDINDFINYCDASKANKVFYEASPINLFYLFVFSNLNNYVDHNQLKLNNEEVVKLLETIKNETVSNSLDNSIDGVKFDNKREEYDKKFEDDLCLLDYSFISLDILSSMIENEECKDPVFVGIPSVSSGGVMVTPVYSVAIFESSENTNGAVQFIKMLLDDQIQNSVSPFIPLKTSSFDKIADSLNLKRKQVENIENLVNEASVVEFDNNSLWNSIIDEVGAYFNNEITAEELLKSIENKYTLYYNETK